MDALARSGMLFRNAFVAYPVCSSSKACIYTGLHNHRTGLLNNTVNFHQPAAELTPAQRRFPLYVRNRIAAGHPDADRAAARQRLLPGRHAQAARRPGREVPLRRVPAEPDGRGDEGLPRSRDGRGQSVVPALQHPRHASAVSGQRQGADPRAAGRGEAAGVSARHAGRAEGLGGIPRRHRARRRAGGPGAGGAARVRASRTAPSSSSWAITAPPSSTAR